MDNDSLQANSEAPQLAEPEQKPFPWAEVISSVWFHRKWIAIFVTGVTLVAIGVTFLIQPLYTAQTSILPELTKERTLGLAGLASVAEATGTKKATFVSQRANGELPGLHR